MSTAENIGWWIGIVGSLASIGAAIWAFVEARKAKESANTASRIKDELVNRRNLVEISLVYKEANRVIASLTKVGPACTEESVRGIDSSEIASQAEDFVNLLNTNRKDLPASLVERVDTLLIDMKVHVPRLAEAKSFEEKKSAGKLIYYRINELMPEIKALADEKKANMN